MVMTQVERGPLSTAPQEPLREPIPRCKLSIGVGVRGVSNRQKLLRSWVFPAAIAKASHHDGLATDSWHPPMGRSRRIA
jgi:hypothetical protein